MVVWFLLLFFVVVAKAQCVICDSTCGNWSCIQDCQKVIFDKPRCFVDLNSNESIDSCSELIECNSGVCPADPSKTCGRSMAELSIQCPEGGRYDPESQRCVADKRCTCSEGSLEGTNCVLNPTQTCSRREEASSLEIEAYVYPTRYLNPTYVELYEPYNGNICRWSWYSSYLYAQYCGSNRWHFRGYTPRIPITLNAYVEVYIEYCGNYEGGYGCYKDIHASCTITRQGSYVNVCGDLVPIASGSGTYRKEVRGRAICFSYDDGLYDCGYETTLFTIEINYRNDCPTGTSYDPNTGKCVREVCGPTCPSGWTLQGDRCIKPAECSCPSGYTEQEGRCVKTVEIPQVVEETVEISEEPPSANCTPRFFSGKARSCRAGGVAIGGASCCGIGGLLSFVCNQSEKELKKMREAGICTEVGEYCSKWLKVSRFKTCVEKSRGYCCFNSELARIINECGRPQIGKGWGPAQSPDCSGFTMDEFTSIDLSRQECMAMIEAWASRFAQEASNKLSSGEIANRAINAVQDWIYNVSR